MDVTWYGQEVFRKTSEISKQVFPMTLDIDHPRWRPNLDRMEAASRQIAAAKERGGVLGFASRVGWYGQGRVRLRIDLHDSCAQARSA